MPLDILPSDPAGILQQVLRELQWIADALNPAVWVGNAMRTSSEGVVDTATRYLFSTGNREHPFTADAAITSYAPMVRILADLCLVCVASWASYRVMWARGTRSLYSVRVLLPRLMLSAVLINFALPLFQAAVEVNNAACAVVGQVRGIDLLAVLKDATNDLASGPQLTVLTGAALLIGYLMLAFAYIVRYALLVVLAITAPAAALLFVLPETHHLARQWTSLFVTTLFMQPLQLLILAVGLSLNLQTSWSPAKHAFALAALFIAFRVPGALHQSSMIGNKAFSGATRHATKLVHAVAKA
jgi:hypothetical protein